jgi:uncharacterized oligopeptide transporter (OPT) family protein
MPLFQRPPASVEEHARARPLDLPPEEVGTMDAATWRARAFRGDVPQLTVRAVAMGTALGFLLAFTNVYVGLKTGWGLGVALTACIASFTVWSTFQRLGIVRTPMTILENNCMQSTASAAGMSTVTLLVTAVPAMLLLSTSDANPLGTPMRWYVVLPWVICVGALGVLMGIPMKRSMIDRERLKFPSGTAAAVLLQSLYSEGAEALAKGRALLLSGCLGALVPLATALNVIKGTAAGGHVERRALLPSQSPLFDWLPRIAATHRDAATHALVRQAYPLSAWNVVLDHSVVLFAAGAIVGMRTTLSMLAGAFVQVVALGPRAMEWEWANPAGALVPALTRPGAAWKEIGLWFGAPMMVAYGLTAFAMQGGTIGRALRDVAGGRTGVESADDGIDVPFAWFAVGTGVAAAAVIALAQIVFEIPFYYGALAVLLTFFLALVACRATGETDITPIGAMGKIVQLTYGALMPQSYTANLMTASITASASAESADLLNDLKSGYLLGAHPRRQFVAQFFGIFPGAVAAVLSYFLLVPDATALTGVNGKPPAFAAPAAQQWKAVAELFRLGPANLHPMARWGIALGLALGVALALAERFTPSNRRSALPSATGIGLGLMLPFYTSLSFALGALAASAFGRWDARRGDRYIIPVASGLIAGESVVGVIVAALNSFILT